MLMGDRVGGIYGSSSSDQDASSRFGVIAYRVAQDLQRSGYSKGKINNGCLDVLGLESHLALC